MLSFKFSDIFEASPLTSRVNLFAVSRLYATGPDGIACALGSEFFAVVKIPKSCLKLNNLVSVEQQRIAVAMCVRLLLVPARNDAELRRDFPNGQVEVAALQLHNHGQRIPRVRAVGYLSSDAQQPVASRMIYHQSTDEPGVAEFSAPSSSGLQLRFHFIQALQARNCVVRK